MAGLDPGLVCGEQHPTQVKVQGKGLTPLPSQTLTGEHRTEWPALALRHVGALDGSAGSEVSIQLDEHTGALLWSSSSELQFTVGEGLVLDPGVYDLEVTNPDGQQASGAGALAVAPAPTLASAEPELVCGEQDASLVLDGTGFLRIAGVLPEVSLGEVRVDVVAGECWDIGATGAASCEQLVLDLPAGTLDPGLYPLAIANPEPHSCRVVDAPAIEVVAAPVIETVSRALVCLEQGGDALDIVGTGFLVVDGRVPTVQIGDWTASEVTASGCRSLEDARHGQACTGLSVTLPTGAMATGVHTLVVTNPDPADCGASQSFEVEVVGAPRLDAVQPLLFCNQQGTVDVVLSGSGFIVAGDGERPAVAIGGELFEATTASDCTPLAGPAGGQLCRELGLQLPAEALEAELADVAVVNPAPADCWTDTLQVLSTSQPELASIGAQLLCVADSDRTLALLGSDFVAAGGELPTIWLDSHEVPADRLDGCVELPGTSGAQACARALATLAEGSLDEGIYQVTLVNPETGSCETGPGFEVELVPAPAIDSLDPTEVCVAEGDQQVTFSGSGLLLVGSLGPTVQITHDSGTVGTAGYVSLGGCEPLGGPVAGQACSSIVVTVPEGTEEGTWQVAFVNPAQASCSSEPVELVVSPPPAIEEVADACEGADSFVVTGSGFDPDVSATVDGEPAGILSVSSTAVEVELPSGLPAGSYEVTLSNPTGCSSSGTLALHANPTLYDLDPAVISVSHDFAVRVWGDDFATLSEAVLGNATGESMALEIEAQDSDPDRLDLVVPAGASADTWSLTVTDELGCRAELADALTTLETVSVDVGAQPPALSAAVGGEIELSGDFSPDDARAFLVDSGGVARSLPRSWTEDDALHIALAAGAETGEHDLVLVVADGTLGGTVILVEEEAPPAATALDRYAVPSDQDLELVVSGTDFADPGAELSCLLPGGSQQEIAAVVTTSTSTTAVLFVAREELPDAATCAVVLTNAGSLIEARLPGLSLSPTGSELAEWAAGTNLEKARQAPATAILGGTDQPRRVYAVGGIGASGVALSTTEVAELDDWGQPSAWRTLPGELPLGLARAQAVVIDDHIYAVGGGSSGSAVYRAAALAPADRPVLSDLTLAYGLDSALEGGTWVYRVTALYDADDPDNPGGESLPSLPWVVRAPSVPLGVTVRLAGTLPEGAVGYRVYRSPLADMPSGYEESLASELGASFVDWTDDATLDTSPSALPPTEGDLGSWVDLGADLDAPRWGHCMAVAPDPTEDGRWWIYAIGGEDSAAVILSSIERLGVDAAGPRDHTLWGWSTSEVELDEGRVGCSAAVLTPELLPSLSDSYLYVWGGDDGYGVLSDGYAGLVDTGGLLTADGWWPLTADDAQQSNEARAGAALFAAGEALHLAGGADGGASSDMESALLCDGTGCGFFYECTTTFETSGLCLGYRDDPWLEGWQVDSSELVAARVDAGWCQAPGVAILVGGAQAGVPLQSTEVSY